MSYTWTTGEVITADKLNSMNSGSEHDFVLDTRTSPLTATGKSVNELYDMVVAGIIPDVIEIQSSLIDKYNSLIYEVNEVDGNDIKAFGFNEGDFANTFYGDGTAFIWGDAYTFTYDSTTKTYTFTPSGNSGSGGGGNL